MQLMAYLYHALHSKENKIQLKGWNALSFRTVEEEKGEKKQRGQYFEDSLFSKFI